VRLIQPETLEVGKGSAGNFKKLIAGKELITGGGAACPIAAFLLIKALRTGELQGAALRV
jgi:hypothetical protein